jgi:hypothetical protein
VTDAPLVDLVGIAVRITLRGMSGTGADDLVRLDQAVDAVGATCPTDPAENLVLWAADCVGQYGLNVDTFTALKAALKVWSHERARRAEPGTLQADPHYWWKREAGGMA